MFNLETAQEGDVLGWKPEDIVGKLITMFSLGKYCHVGYYTTDNKTIEAHLKLDGVKETKIDPSKYHLIDVFRLKEVEKYSIKNLTSSFVASIGLKYDAISFFSKFVRGVLRLGAKDKPIFNSRKDRDCAENIALCFKANGINLTPNVHPQSTTPSQICKSKSFRKVS